MSLAPVSSSLPELAGLGAPDAERTWVVQAGDTLGNIARQLRRDGASDTTAELVRTLCRLNGITNPDRIDVGQVLRLPPRALASSTASDRLDAAHPDAGRASVPLRADERQALLQNALFRVTRGRSAEVAPEQSRSADGTPLFRQGDPAWSTERLGSDGQGPTLARAGCAVTACAMALSRLAGAVLTPGALVRHLRDAGGFEGPLLDWSHAGSAVAGSPKATPGAFDGRALDRELDSGRPVLLRVVHDVQGRDQQHWICVTGRDARTGRYTANDPATGRQTALLAREGALATAPGEPVRYASDARMVTFAQEAAASDAG